jgi:hypothetical protein
MSKPGLPARVTEAADELDQRFHLAAGLRRQINKVFPNHWSFMLGEIALYSFIVLLLSGTYLALYFDPSLAEVKYHGSFVPLRGIEMSKAYENTLDLSFDVRGGRPPGMAVTREREVQRPRRSSVDPRSAPVLRWVRWRLSTTDFLP